MTKNKKEKSLITRKTILDAAEEVFFEVGFSGASLEEIARRACVTRGAIYWHFENKTQILEAVIDRTVFVYEDAIHALTNTANNIEQLRLFAIGLLQGIAADANKRRALSIIFFRHEHLESEACIVARENDALRRFATSLTEFFQRVDCTPFFGDVPAHLIAQSLMFYVHGAITVYVKHEALIPMSLHAEEYVNLFFRPIVNKDT